MRSLVRAFPLVAPLLFATACGTPTAPAPPERIVDLCSHLTNCCSRWPATIPIGAPTARRVHSDHRRKYRLALADGVEPCR